MARHLSRRIVAYLTADRAYPVYIAKSMSLFVQLGQGGSEPKNVVIMDYFLRGLTVCLVFDDGEIQVRLLTMSRLTPINETNE